VKGKNEGNTQRALLFLKIAVVTVAVLTATLPFRAERVLVNKPLLEDCYYTFAVARNLASGQGITIDGSAWTNGFQPLFTFLIVPLFHLTADNLLLPIRLVLLLHWAVFLATAGVVGRIAQDAFARGDSNERSLVLGVGVFLYLCSLFGFMMHFNGLETGFFLLMLSLAWRYFQIGRMDTGKGQILFGLLLGLVVLARIDAVFLVVVVCLASSGLGCGRKRWSGLGKIVRIGGTAFLVSLPWWLYNLVGFGSLMPSSGKAQQAWAFSRQLSLYENPGEVPVVVVRAGHALSALSQGLVPWLYTSRFGGGVPVLVRLAIIVLALIYLRREWRARQDAGGEENPSGDVFNRTAVFARTVLLSALLLAAWYGLSSWAVHFYGRYLAFLILPAAVYAAMPVSRFLKKSPRIGTAGVAFLTALLLAAVGMAHTGLGIKGNVNFTEQLQLVRQNVPEGQRVAAGQSGTLGYFRAGVVNLDGKVNPEALKYQNRMNAYLEREGIHWLCDYPSYCRYYLGADWKSWKKVADKGAFALYHREAPTPRVESTQCESEPLPLGEAGLLTLLW